MLRACCKVESFLKVSVRKLLVTPIGENHTNQNISNCSTEIHRSAWMHDNKNKSSKESNIHVNMLYGYAIYWFIIDKQAGGSCNYTWGAQNILISLL
jgi:hypothetical protein